MSPPFLYPYTVTNSGYFMRQNTRNVRRAWDGDDYQPLKRVRLENDNANAVGPQAQPDNTAMAIDLEDNLERAIRETSVAALSTTSSRKNSTVFSSESREDDATDMTTPPSSPPPQLQLTPPTRKADAAAPRWNESKPLAEIHNSSHAPPPSRPSSSFTAVNTLFSREPGNLCGMAYTPSVAEDKALHEMFHHRHSAGIELGKAFLKSAMKWCYEVPNIPGAVVVVDRKISLPGRNVVQRVLEVVNKELGSVDIKEDDLWSQRPLPGEDESKKYDRYKAFLHVLNGKCVGICLAERIHHASRVLPESDDRVDSLPLNTSPGRQDVEMTDIDLTPRPKQRPTNMKLADTDKSTLPAALPSPPMSSAPSSAIATSQDTVPAIVGVSRIWTSKAFRRMGIANNLLECVMNKFIYGMDIEKTEMAFSQPTESGAALARGWFGHDNGWCVYTED
ncbi:hypothetical protein DV736_g2968, partial [Chaetothyriales sp. CBS 134916]